MTKQAMKFSYRKRSVFGRKIPLKSNGGLNRVYLTLTDFNFILFITIFLVSASVYAQDNKYALKDFKFTELSEVYTRKDIMDKYVCTKQSYTAIALSSNLKDKVSHAVINSFNEWNSLVIIPKMDDRYIWINDQAIVAVDNKMSNNQNEKIIKEESILQINKEQINEMSLILNGKGDTLVLIPIKVEQSKSKSGKIEYQSYLYCQNLEVINKINFIKSIIKSVVQLEEHASILSKYGLKLDQSDIDQFNNNIQNRVIDSINALLIKSPEIYCVVANTIARTNQFFKPLASAYIVLKNDKSSFISNEKKCSGLPTNNYGLFNLTMTDSVELSFDKNELINKIRSINYYEYFTANFPKKTPNIYGNLQPKEPFELDDAYFMSPIGFPKMDSTIILHNANESWWGNVIVNKKLTERPEKLDFDKFFQNHVTNDTLSSKRLINLPETFDKSKIQTWYSLIQLVKYTKNGLTVEVKLGDNNKDRLVYTNDFKTIYDEYSINYNTKNNDFFESYSFQKPVEENGICAFNRDKLYQFYSGYMDIYSRECNKIDSLQNVMKQNEEMRQQNEEALQQEMIAKYGQKYVDAMLKLIIIVGMHEDLVKVIVNKLYYIESTRSTANQKCYRLDPKYGTGWVSVCIENNKVSSVAYH